MNYNTNMAEIGIRLTELAPTKGGYNFVGCLVNRDFVTIVGFITTDTVNKSTVELKVGSAYRFKGYLKDCKKKIGNKVHLTQLKVISFEPHPKGKSKDIIKLTGVCDELLDSGMSINEKKYTDVKVNYLSTNLLNSLPYIRVWEPATKALKFFTKGQLAVINAYITNNIETDNGISLLIVPSQLTFLKDSELQFKVLQ